VVCVKPYVVAGPKLVSVSQAFSPVTTMILDHSWLDFFDSTFISPPRIVTAAANATSTTDIMSAHHLSIAKASFAAGLLRPDVTKVGREDLTTFNALLEAAITRCTPRNIQV
jgi:hypothetical protein